MTQQLILELPSEVYQPLADSATRTGQTPEQLAVAWLGAVSRLAAADPLEEFIGALPSGVPDWTAKHDLYLGQAIAQKSLEPKDSGN